MSLALTSDRYYILLALQPVKNPGFLAKGAWIYSIANWAVSVPVLGIVSASYPGRNWAVSVPVLGIASPSYPYLTSMLETRCSFS